MPLVADLWRKMSDTFNGKMTANVRYSFVLGMSNGMTNASATTGTFDSRRGRPVVPLGASPSEAEMPKLEVRDEDRKLVDDNIQRMLLHSERPRFIRGLLYSVGQHSGSTGAQQIFSKLLVWHEKAAKEATEEGMVFLL